ncbi:MAG: DeoR family transcriptional regulator [Halobacteria archaeon]|nr:DeoR family transcriptional regulator [Halobacteria archaeon]
MPVPDDIIEAVWRRQEFIEVLSEDTKTKRNLVEELDYSEQTVYKRLKELRENNLIRRSDGAYSLTPFGKLVFDKFAEIEDICDLDEILTKKSHEEIDSRVLEGANVIQSDDEFPQRPLNYITDRLMDSDLVEGFSCTLFSPSRVEAYQEAVVENGVKLKTVTNPEVIMYLTSEHSEEISSAIKSGNMTVWLTDKDIPFSTIIFDKSEIGVVIFESNTDAKGIMEIKCVVTNDSESAVNWALEKTRWYIENSSKIDIPI